MLSQGIEIVLAISIIGKLEYSIKEWFIRTIFFKLEYFQFENELRDFEVKIYNWIEKMSFS